MFDDFEFEDKYNPWDVKNLQEFYYYCCPSCPLKNVNKTDFIKHALTAHTESQNTIDGLEDNKDIVKNEEYIENFESELEEKFNPWDVKSLIEFCYYCCPECPSKFVNKTDFIKHAVIAHPQSQSTIEYLEDNKAVVKTENYPLMKKAVVSLPKLSDTVIRKYTKGRHRCDKSWKSELIRQMSLNFLTKNKHDNM